MADGFDFEFDANIDLELDFDINDFDFGDKAGEPQGRVMIPRMDKAGITHKILYENAEAFAKQIDLTDGSRTFAWVNGSFVFGDIIEALCTARNMRPKNIYICSLGIGEENIDSLRNIMDYFGCEHLYMLLSGYFYSHEKFGLIPYLYERLDIDDKFQVAFGNYHGKIICIETHSGHTMVIHGSANLRSSYSIEQLMVEVGQQDIFDFNAGLIKALCERYATIDYTKPHIEGKAKLWQAVQQVAEADAADGAAEAAHSDAGKPTPGSSEKSSVDTPQSSITRNPGNEGGNPWVIFDT